MENMQTSVHCFVLSSSEQHYYLKNKAHTTHKSQRRSILQRTYDQNAVN